MMHLLLLPLELRQKIIQHVINDPLCPVPSSSTSRLEDRQRLGSLHIYMPKEKARAFADGLLRTNRQLRQETKAEIRLVKTLNYEVDVLFVDNHGLWPTWISIPYLSQHADALIVRLRVPAKFVGGYLPNDNSRSWHSSQLEMVSFAIRNFFQSYFQWGPGFSKPPCPYRVLGNTLEKLVIDVSYSLEDPPLHVPAVNPSMLLNPTNFYDGDPDQFPDYWPRPTEIHPDNILAEMLARYLSKTLFGRSLLPQFGTIARVGLFGGIKYTELRVNGEHRLNIF